MSGQIDEARYPKLAARAAEWDADVDTQAAKLVVQGTNPINAIPLAEDIVRYKREELASKKVVP
jgi:hypothetical protein